MNLSKILILGAALVGIGALTFSSAKAGDKKFGPPFFVQPPTPCNEQIICAVGVETCVTIQASSPFQIPILLNWNNIPTGGTTNPLLPLLTQPGQDAITQFCWTPGLGDVGQTYMAVFTAFNNNLDGLDEKCDVFFKVETGLSAELSSFDANVKFVGGPMLVTWSTSSEIDHAFFNVYRSKTTFENAVMINNTPIMSLGSPVDGATYSQLDRTITTGNLYKYWLEAVDIFGQTQVFGPIQAFAR